MSQRVRFLSPDLADGEVQLNGFSSDLQFESTGLQTNAETSLIANAIQSSESMNADLEWAQWESALNLSNPLISTIYQIYSVSTSVKSFDAMPEIWDAPDIAT